eukprot:TRINITY_DN12143_c0_g1_i1.p2 TRINITY_DN12143_c0_g1~~TRINITY_DN12143_c0_g1_i1.p2  ORF type:complete len:287 (-),score=54.60 TRINITY_DN12143_c0_g1_i1:2820-3680(-)
MALNAVEVGRLELERALEYPVQIININSNNSYKYKVCCPDSSFQFVKLCRHHELKMTLMSCQAAPEQTLTAHYLEADNAIFAEGSVWMVLPWAGQDGFTAVLAVRDVYVDSLTVLKRCLEQLAAYHKLTGMVHGDCKLDNFVIVAGEQLPRLIDFEHVVEPGTMIEAQKVLGTPLYAAPECRRLDDCGCEMCNGIGYPIDQTSDVFSLAASFMHVAWGITLQEPSARCRSAIFDQLNGGLVLRGLDPELALVMLAMCNPCPAGRLTAAEAAHQLGAWLAKEEAQNQ